MPEEWLIDGYNLLHGLTGQNKKNKILRQDLFEILANFSGQGDRQLTLVLDGKGNDDEFRPYLHKTFHIVYSQSVSADSYIEKIVYEKKGKALLVVVTKDRAITNMARGSGARVMNIEDFMDLIKSSKAEAKDFLFEQQAESHGFNRPFQKKLKPIE